MPERQRFCAVCKRLIPAERIAAEPRTRLCLEHGKAIRKYGGEFLGRAEYGSLGKKESLKKNYGDISVTWRRNEQGLSRLLDEYDHEQWEKKSMEQG